MRQLKITKQVTNRETASLDKYLQEIGRVELISAEEEVELAQRIKQGDQKALEKLTKANLRFVVSVSKQYQNQGLSLPDLINEGNLGLIKAAQRFDETRGFKFISYAVWWIRQSILQALAEQSRIVRLPLNKIGSINKINKAFAQLEQEHERAPNHGEIADLLDIPENEVKESMKNSGRHVSMDAPLIQDEETTMYDVIRNEGPTPETGLIYESLRKEINRAIATLTPREADVVKLYFGLDG
ncbi:MAG: RNA polymerase sigma factor RpoD/SigA, partial [Bacteroidales bacterium]